MQSNVAVPVPSIEICGVLVRTDEHGRYQLNDLHRAAGGQSKHQPANWLRLQQTQELAAAIDKEEIPHIRGIESKQGVGTFICKELVYAYAMWVSPEFHLRVIRTYDQLVSVKSLEIPPNYAAALRLAADQQEALEAKNRQIAVMQPQVDTLVRIAGTDTTMCIRDAAKHLQQSPMKFQAWLESMKWIYRRTDNGKMVAYQDRIDSGHIVHKLVEHESRDGGTKTDPQPRITAKGLTRLGVLIEKGQGPTTGFSQ